MDSQQSTPAGNQQFASANDVSAGPPPPTPPAQFDGPINNGSAGGQPSQNLAIGPAPDEVEMDKAWIDRAVTLLDQTRDDPYLQSQEIAKLKAQYMQARFDKQIKIAQEHK